MSSKSISPIYYISMYTADFAGPECWTGIYLWLAPARQAYYALNVRNETRVYIARGRPGDLYSATRNLCREESSACGGTFMN